MKKIFLIILSLFMFGIFADELPANFSKYQAHYAFKCDQGEKCAAVFDKYMNAPAVKAMNLEVDLYALQHQGWNEATHQISYYYKIVPLNLFLVQSTLLAVIKLILGKYL